MVDKQFKTLEKYSAAGQFMNQATILSKEYQPPKFKDGGVKQFANLVRMRTKHVAYDER